VWAEALARAPAGHPWQVRAFLIFLNVLGFFVLTLLTAAAVGLALYCCWLVYVSLRPRGPEHLSAGPEGLRYEFEGPLRLRRQVREVPWDELGEVRIEQPMGREGPDGRPRRRA